MLGGFLAICGQAENSSSEWDIFVGYLYQLLQIQQVSTPPNPPQSQPTKPVENEDDWNYLLNSEYHLDQQGRNPSLKFLSPLPGNITNNTKTRNYNNNITSTPTTSKSSTNETLTPSQYQQIRDHLDLIVYSLHLLYENYKLNVLTKELLPALGQLLSNLASKLGWTSFCDHYCRDLGSRITTTATTQVNLNTQEPPFVPDIYAWMVRVLLLQPQMQQQEEIQQIEPFPILIGNKSPCDWIRKICRY